MITTTSGVVMVVSTGLWAGAVLAITVERLHRWRGMSDEDYAADFRRATGRDDPLMPVLAVLGTAGAVVFALRGTGAPTTLAWVGAALGSSAVVLSLVVLEPIQRRFRKVGQGEVPVRVGHHRATWRRVHQVRTALAMAAFAALAAAANL